MECIPKYMPITELLVKSREYGLAIISGIMEGLLLYEGVKEGNLWCFCGNCSAPLIMLKGTTRPNVCSKCGCEIKWNTSEIKRVKIQLREECPKCKKEGSLDDEFCRCCLPPQKLIVEPIRFIFKKRLS